MSDSAARKPVWAGVIARARKRLGITQNGLAEIMGVSQSTVTDWERGKTRPRSHNSEKLSDILGLQKNVFENDDLISRLEVENGGELQETDFNKLMKSRQLELFCLRFFYALNVSSKNLKYSITPHVVSVYITKTWIRAHDMLRGYPKNDIARFLEDSIKDYIEREERFVRERRQRRDQENSSENTGNG